MERAAILQLFAFTDYTWDKHERALRPLGDALLLKPAPGSGWPALRDALVHINWAYVRWLHEPSRTSNLPVEAVSSWRELDEYRQRARGHARRYLGSLDDEELQAVMPMSVDGEIVRYSPGEIFAHVLLHEREHHGDIGTLLYQLSLDVPLVEYRFSLNTDRP
jgi:uncharacterized damage-inducible protein DinB